MRILASNLLLFSFLIFSSGLNAQTLIYKGYKGDEYIGDMVVSKKQEGDKVYFMSDAQLKVNFILSWELRFYYEAEFEGGILQKSLVKLSRDGKLKTLVKGEKKGNTFYSEVDRDPVETRALIDFCILNTYFEAPGNRTRIFSERWGDFIDIQSPKEGIYLFEPPNGSKNTLIYKDGICQQMQFNHTLAKVKFVLKE